MSHIASILTTLARLTYARGDFSSPAPWLDEVLSIARQIGDQVREDEALITYGRVLARSERYGAALATFRRVIELSDTAGMVNRAAEATLAAFRELGDHLVVSERGQLRSGRGVVQDKLAMEHEVIRLALEQADGWVTRAARLAGMSHQALAYALRTRHKDLQDKRKPPQQRNQGQ